MDDREQRRKIRHRLAVLRHAEEVSGNVAATCRYCGISRTVFYRWKNRFDELGAEGRRRDRAVERPSPLGSAY
ncbi:helix-turn-helix domain-containing protein [Candidatus Poriferisodalis sp.]|uniref:helix-turn-helix domain-containing protein n=1 Tax=Candidatus Poriferisodalis sp. TaxID=3101277 RepID=UPI003B5BA89B